MKTTSKIRLVNIVPLENFPWLKFVNFGIQFLVVFRYRITECFSLNKYRLILFFLIILFKQPLGIDAKSLPLPDFLNLILKSDDIVFGKILQKRKNMFNLEILDSINGIATGSIWVEKENYREILQNALDELKKPEPADDVLRAFPSILRFGDNVLNDLDYPINFQVILFLEKGLASNSYKVISVRNGQIPVKNNYAFLRIFTYTDESGIFEGFYFLPLPLLYHFPKSILNNRRFYVKVKNVEFWDAIKNFKKVFHWDHNLNRNIEESLTIAADFNSISKYASYSPFHYWLTLDAHQHIFWHLNYKNNFNLKNYIINNPNSLLFNKEIFWTPEIPSIQTGQIVNRTFTFQNGKIRAEISLKASDNSTIPEPDGVWHYYFENGQKEAVFEIKNRVLCGPCKEWDQSGNLVFEHHFKGTDWEKFGIETDDSREF